MWVLLKFLMMSKSLGLCVCDLKWEFMCMYIRTALILESLRESKENLTWTFEIVQVFNLKHR